jgi:uncharacterized repeat protein (TIGR01451 family)
VRTALAGSYVDFPHLVRAGTAGHVDLSATNTAGAVTMLFLDANANAVFDTGDRPLEPTDTDLDPAAGSAEVSVLVRLFVPPGTPEATTIHVGVSALQVLAAGDTLSAGANDAAVVVGSALGRVVLSKSSDRSGAAPGEVITYTIEFFNAGGDSIQNLEIVDPISPWVELQADAFGPGLDLEWQRAGDPPVYLTFSALDADECEYNASERLLRLLFSRTDTFYMSPGETGRLIYRVQVR